MRWLAYFLRPHWKLFTLLTFNRCGRMVFFMGVQPLLIAKMIGAFEDGSAFADPSILWTYLTLFAVGSSLIFLLLILCAEEAKLADRIGRGARLLGLSHLNRLSANWHEQAASGGKLQKIMSGSIAIQEIVRTWFIYVLGFIAGFIGTSVALIGMGVPGIYVGLTAAMMASYLGFAWWTSIYLARGYDMRNTLLENLSGKVYEFVNATLTVKIFNLGDHILKHAKAGEQEGYEQAGKVYSFDYMRWIGLNFIGLFWVGVMMIMAIQDTLNQTISVAAFALIAYQLMSIWGLMEDFTSVYSKLVEQGSALGRLVHLLRQPIQVDDADNQKQLQVEQGAIEFHNICFSYNAKNKVFEGLELKIKPGEKVGIVGGSGSGKSTLVKLLLRFYDPSNNEITIDRQNISKISQDSLRQNIAVIPQDTSLFNHSIMDNIRYGRLDASDEDVLTAAKLAHADEFIQKLPDGYDTLVGEHGTRLSGGQRQRIAIARAILKDAPILVLDEATSALDSESEQLIQQSLDGLMRDKTVIAIAHRLSTIASMDRILVFDQGKMIEEGSHVELLAKKGGRYAQLWNMQSSQSGPPQVA